MYTRAGGAVSMPTPPHKVVRAVFQSRASVGQSFHHALMVILATWRENKECENRPLAGSTEITLTLGPVSFPLPVGHGQRKKCDFQMAPAGKVLGPRSAKFSAIVRKSPFTVARAPRATGKIQDLGSTRFPAPWRRIANAPAGNRAASAARATETQR